MMQVHYCVSAGSGGRSGPPMRRRGQERALGQCLHPPLDVAVTRGSDSDREGLVRTHCYCGSY